jgi:2-succinyl-5-enolpyruvyl-6-hydroxy-3-cyclohexene-1-carboxylate synthase
VKGRAANINAYWANLIVGELIRNGVRQFFVSPGSRNSPLVVAVTSRPDADCVTHFDERGSGFLALGFGSHKRIPAVWITTSGTAVANGYPAVVEASQAGVPLILLTADRPFELRDVGANQTIDQVRIFGDHARWSVDLPTPSDSIAPESVLTLVDQAVAKSTMPPAGPVHLNLPFREPLAPTKADYTVDEHGIEQWLTGNRPFTKYSRAEFYPSEEALADLKSAVAESRRGLIVLGGLPASETAEDILTLVSNWGWPIVADIASQTRLGAKSDLVVPSPHFTTLLESQDTPDVIFRFGSKIVSKSINTFLKDARPQTLAIVSSSVRRNDPDHRTTHQILSAPSHFCRAAAGWSSLTDPEWLARWTRTSRLNPVLDQITRDSARVSEPGVARRITQLIPPNQVLYLASSMPIRDVDMFADGSANTCWVGANRGASGIDGTIASGVGAGIAAGHRATILCGDLALLHDLNSLSLLTARSDVVVVLNNDGGGIFSFLPIADHEELFEQWFGTPHGYSFRSAADLFGLRYEKPETMSDFTRAYSEASKAAESTLIEIRTDRTENAKLHRDLEQEISSVLS